MIELETVRENVKKNKKRRKKKKKTLSFQFKEDDLRVDKLLKDEKIT